MVARREMMQIQESRAPNGVPCRVGVRRFNAVDFDRTVFFVKWIIMNRGCVQRRAKREVVDWRGRVQCVNEQKGRIKYSEILVYVLGGCVCVCVWCIILSP